MTDTLYSTRDVAARLGLSAQRVRQLAASRGLGRIIGRSHVFTPDDLAAMAIRTPGRPRQPDPAKIDRVECP